MAILNTLFSFPSGFSTSSGNDPNGALVMDSAGDLFGTTSGAGSNGSGTVFELAATATGYASAQTTLVSASYYGGQPPGPDVIIDAAGDLFGDATNGGANDLGTVYEIANTGAGYATAQTVLFNFSTSSGGKPNGNMVMDSAGDLFGTTSTGGAYSNGSGTVFEIAKTAAGYAGTATVLASFNGNNTFETDNDIPYDLTVDSAGDLFGVTQDGGDGMVFEIAKTANGYSSTPATVASFDGSYPSGDGSLLVDAAGDLFGTTANTVFEIVKTASGYSSTPVTLASFNGTDGSGADINLVMDGAGNLFGTTAGGGAYDYGTIFEIAKTATGYASSPTTLVNFDGSDGAEPRGGLLIDAAGNLIGTTEFGGPGANPYIFINETTGGTIFEFVSSAAVVVSVSGTAQQGQTLTANTNQVVGAYQWQRLINGQWTDISGATGASYVVQQADVGYQLHVEVTDTAGFTVTTAASNAVFDAAGNQPVYQSDSADQSTIGNGLFQYVFGSATGTTVNGGEQNIYATGTATNTTLNAGAVQVDWGSATGTTIDGGSQYVWGSATDTTINSGVQGVGAGATATNTTIDVGGEQVVGGGGMASGTWVDGGFQAVYGSADQTTVNAGGLQQVHGSVTNTVVNSGGEQNIYVDGSASGTTVNASGVQIDWGSATGTTIDGGSQYVWGSATDTTINSGGQGVGAGATATNTTIDVGGEQVVGGGGTASGTWIDGGFQAVYGSADQTTVNSGGLQEVHGSVTNTVVNSGGEQKIYVDGSASSTTVNASATQIDWGSATGTTIQGGTQYVDGTATSTTLTSGMQIVEAGGSVSDTTIGSSGAQNIYAGGSATNTTIAAGASEHVYAGGAASGVTFAGPNGLLQLDQSSGFSGTIAGCQVGDLIRLGDIAFNGAGTALAYAANGDHSGGTLTVSDGTHTASLALLGQYAASAFALSSDGHGGTLVTDRAAVSQQNVLAPALS